MKKEVLLALLLTACTASQGPAIITSIYPVHFFASAIAGPDVPVHTLLPAGVEPHGFEPTPQDIMLVQDSNFFIYLGGGMEPWAERIVESTRVPAVGILDDIHAPPHGMESDPHIWLDPLHAKDIVYAIEETLAGAFPQRAGAFAQRSAELEKSLMELHEEYKQGLSDCKHRTFIAAHSAYGHLAARYGLEMLSIAGLSPEGEPSPRSITNLIQRIKESGIRYVFAEPFTSPRVAASLAQEAGVELLPLHPIGGITRSDENYFGLMRENLKNLRIGLECQ